VDLVYQVCLEVSVCQVIATHQPDVLAFRF